MGQLSSDSLPQLLKEIGIEAAPKPKTKKQMAKAKSGVQYPWAEIKSEYITGYVIPDVRTGAKIHIYPTLEELAEKYGCSPYYIRSKSSKESWSQSRKMFQAVRQEKAEIGKFHAVLSESASSDARTLAAVDKLYALVEAYFQQYEDMELCDDGKFRLTSSSYTEDEDGNLLVREVKVNDLKGIVDVLDKAQALVRRTVGEPKEMLKSDTFNPMAGEYDDGTDSAEGSKKKGKVDKLIEKRQGLSKSKEQLRAEIAALKSRNGEGEGEGEVNQDEDEND